MGSEYMGAVDRSIEEAALGFEAQKVFVRQSRDGVVVGFSIDPMNVPADLYTSPVGSRYYVSIVQVGDNEQPVKPVRLTEGRKAVAKAHLLCREQKFQQWLVSNGYALAASEDDARAGVLAACSINSRGELATNEMARRYFFQMVDDFTESNARGELL